MSTSLQPSLLPGTDQWAFGFVQKSSFDVMAKSFCYYLEWNPVCIALDQLLWCVAQRYCNVTIRNKTKTLSPVTLSASET
jgi:hypothetical protein